MLGGVIVSLSMWLFVLVRDLHCHISILIYVYYSGSIVDCDHVKGLL